MNAPQIKNPLPAGTILQGKTYRYRIEKALGQGTFGITYLASVKMQGALGELDCSIYVAVKEFFMKETNGREGNTVTSGSKGGLYDKYRNKFAREAENLSRLRHPHIVKVLESFEANNTVYYSMEYVDGGSLDERICMSGGLLLEESVRYLRQIGSALSYMHRNKMLHLDLKPANVVLRKSGEAVLIDFGLSKQYDDNGKPETSTSVGLGTPGYAPIEQAHYRDGKDFPVVMDVYALGATFFKMLTGVRPPNASEILNDGFPVYELQKHNVNASLLPVIAKAMAPTKKNRYQTVEEFLDALMHSGKREETTLLEEEEDTLYEEETIRESVFVVPGVTQRVAISYREYGIPSPSNFDVSINSSNIRVEHYYNGETRVFDRPFSKRRFQEFKLKMDSLNLKCSSAKPDDGEGGTRLTLSFQDAKGENLKRLSTRREEEDDFLYLAANTNVNIVYEIEQLLPELVEFVLEGKNRNQVNKETEKVTKDKKDGWYWVYFGILVMTYLPWIPIYWGLYYSQNYASYDFNHYSYLLFFIPFTILSWIWSWRSIAKSWKGKVVYSIVYAIPLLVFARLLFEPFQVINPEKGGYEWQNIFGKEIVDDYRHFVKTDYIKFENGEKEGLVDLNENVVVPCDYNRVEHLYEDVFMIYKGGDGYGIYKDGKEVIPCMYDNLRPFDPMMADHCFFIACKEDKYGVIDMDGVVKLDFKYDKIELIDGNNDDSLLKIGVKKTVSSVSQMLWGVYSFWDEKEILECKYILIKDVVYNNKRAFECTYHAGLAGFIVFYVDRNGNVLNKELNK